MNKRSNPVIVKYLDWFEQNAGREFNVTKISFAEIRAVEHTGAIVLAARQRPGSGVADIRHSIPDYPCIVRRPNAAEGRPLPEILLFDGPHFSPAPRPQKGKDGSADEYLGREIWRLAQTASAAGISLIDLMGRELRAAAIKAQ